EGPTGITSPRGQTNDLIELTRLQDPLAEIGVGPVNRNGAARPGALPASSDALRDSRDQVSTLRAYAPDLVGWFDDFGHSGFPDAFGGIGRISTTLNTFSAGVPGVPCTFSQLIVPGTCTNNTPGVLSSLLSLKNLRRCPGSNERGQSAS